MQNHQSRATAPIARRARALKQALDNKKLIPEGFIEDFTKQMEVDWDPANGARIVARAWVDPEYRALLLRDGTEPPRFSRRLVDVSHAARARLGICE